MLRPTARLLFGFLWIFTLHRLASGKLECKPGQKMTLSRDRCEPCPPHQYQPQKGDSVECSNCRPCGKNSKEISPCSPTRNTVCQCLQGFSPLHGSLERCRCNKGSGIKTLEDGKTICEKCPNGTFSDKYDAVCSPWKKCDHNGVQTAGSSTSDVVCRNPSKEESRTTLPSPASVLQPETSSEASTLSPAWTQPGPTSPKTTPTPAPPGTKQHGLCNSFNC